MAETVRGGLQGVPEEQEEAAYSLGLKWWQVQFFVTLPQALRIVIPPLINQTLLLFKNTSLAMAIGVGELTYRTREVDSYTFKTFEAYAVATLFYLAVSLGLMGLGALAGKRIQNQAR